ncbi:MAG: hypothetical protein ACMUEL_09045 [Flavobacteriales bacterium Tduv]
MVSKHWFGSSKAPYKGSTHVHTQHLMETMGIIYIVPLASLCTVYENRYN